MYYTVKNGNRMSYPANAYSPDGVLWWKLQKHPGRQLDYGAELKISAWLAFNRRVSEIVTMRELRAALGDAVPNDDEHLNRRLRQLRQRDGWVIPSNKDDRSLSVGTYRIEVIGWHPGLGTPRAANTAISMATRRKVFDRDGSRCTICGVGRGEPYPNEPDAKAVLTVGHITPNDRGGSGSDMNNLRTECSRCNEPIRQELRNPESLEELLPDVRNLRKAELQKLHDWLSVGHRGRDRLDYVYDRARQLGSDERSVLEQRIWEILYGRS